jgi:hypothetical protein
MFGWLSGFQFLAPLTLAGALLLPLLVIAYLRQNPKKKRFVSSVVVLRDLSRKQTIRKKFSPPLRFFLELLALALLCLAGAMPTKRDEQKRIAVIVDNSLSMRALDKSGGTKTRLMEAKEETSKWIADQSRDYEFTVFTSSPKLERIGSAALGRAAAQEAVSQILPTYTNDTLEASVEELSESGDYERVFVSSDRKIEDESDTGTGGVSALDLLRTDRGRKHVTTVAAVVVGTPIPNLSVAAFSLNRSSLGGGAARLSASIAYSGPSPIIAKVFFSVSASGNAKSDRMLGVDNIKVVPDKLVQADLDIPAVEDKNVLYQVRVAPEQAGGFQNAIADDDTAWIGGGEVGQSKVLLITPEESADALGLATLESIKAEAVTPEAFGKLTEEQLRDYALLIFHRSAPVVPPHQSTLLILPPEGNNLFPVERTVDAPRITSWVSEHPITSYLKIPLLAPTAAEIFDVPLWTQAIVKSEQGPILCAGESHGVRFAAVGMELLPFEGGKTPALSVLTLNLLNWLSGSGRLTGSMLSGTAFHLDGGKHWQIEEPNGNVVQRNTAGRDGENFLLAQPGVYRVRNDGAAGSPTVLAINAFFPEESATYGEGIFHAAKVVEQEQLLDQTAKPLWPPLIFAVLGILGVELLLSLSRWGAES